MILLSEVIICFKKFLLVTLSPLREPVKLR